MKTIIKIMTAGAVVVLSLLAISPVIHGEEILYSWDFQTAGNSEGWTATHDLSGFTVQNGILYTTSLGADPYMHGPQVSIDAASFPYLKIRMKVSAGSSAEFFWTLEGMQHELAGYEQGFSLIADDNFHDYLVFVGTHKKWHGKVIRLRLDPTTVAGAKIEIDYIRVLSLGPQLKIMNFGPDVLLPKAEETFHLGCVIENSGDKDVLSIRAAIGLPGGVTLQTPDSVKSADLLAPGEDTEFSWPVQASQPGKYVVSVSIAGDNLSSSLTSVDSITIAAPPGDLPVDIPDDVQAFQFNSDYWILQNSHLRLVIEKWQNFRLFMVKDGVWYQVGASQPISNIEFILNGHNNSVALLPDTLTILPVTPDSLALILAGDYADEDGGVWSFQFQFGLAAEMNHVAARYELRCSQARELLKFTGPTIYLGEGSFGDQLNEAILPGLEWLVNGERSSGTLDAHPPYNERFAPHPRKISAPLIALNQDGVTAGLLWNPGQKWDGSHSQPAIEFSVPNWLEGQKNHKMGMMLPSIPDYIAENEAYPTQPYPLQPGQILTVDGYLFAFNSTSALDAFDYYFDLFGYPKLQPLARSLNDEVVLCRTGFQTVWNDTQKGWQHAIGSNWSFEPYPGYAFLQHLDGLLSPDPVVRASLDNRVNAVVNKILSASGEAGLANRGGCHIPGWQLPFYIGHLDGAISGMKSEPTIFLYSQSVSGGWPFRGNAELGEVGKYELGTCAGKTFLLLDYYKISGDEKYLQSGEKALRFMERFKVPRGAQTWEVPLHTPDILAAAHAIRAYVTGYQITHDSSYLQQARYWARAGFPFIYFWSDPEILTMPFATIPVLGATFYTNPWFGVPVQWCGLVYSHALFQLAQVDPQQPLWRLLAEGITRSAMEMQATAGQNVGTYPDSWNLLTNSAQPVFINPEDIIKNVLFLLGHNPELSNVAVANGSKIVHLTSAANLHSVVLDSSSHSLEFQCDFFPNEPCYVLIAGLIEPPARVLQDGEELAHVNDVDSYPGGWQYTAQGFLILKFLQPATGNAALKIEKIKTGVEPQKAKQNRNPDRFQLNQNYPNPISRDSLRGRTLTTVEYSLPRAENVKLQIYDLRGKLIKTLVNEKENGGEHRVKWDGRDFQNRPVASGLYLCLLSAGKQSRQRKILVLK